MNGFVPQELDEKLASRVQVSQRAVAKIIQVFDHLNQRHERLSRMIRGEDPADKEDEGKAEADGVEKSGKEGDKNGDAKKGDSTGEGSEEDGSKDKSDKDGTKVSCKYVSKSVVKSDPRESNQLHHDSEVQL